MRYNQDFPGLWRKDREVPLWMQNGPDRELHWEFNKKWNRWFTGEGEKWWTRYVPRKVRDRIDNEVKRQIRKMEAQLH